MPIYEGDQYTYEQLSDLRKRNVCAECSGRLDLYQNWGDTRAFIACADWMRTHHEGIMRERSRYEKEGMASLNIKTRREIMEQEHGEGVTTALEKARIPTTGALTQTQAMRILKLVYPKAPEDEIIRCALLCRDFGLHPLMKEVYLIPFKDKGGKDNYVTVLGISATRKLMSQRGSYSYLDNTPRVMTDKEQMTIFGEVDAFNLRAITKLKTATGLEAQGYGSWPRGKEPYGTDKGNSKANMAFIRSERNAFGRLFTDALPQGVEVIDEAYADVPDVGRVNTATGEIAEGEFTELGNEPSIEPTPTAEEHWCSEHNCAFDMKQRGSSVWYSHKMANGKYCNEAKKKVVTVSGPEPAPEPEPQEITAKTIERLESITGEALERITDPATGTLQDLQETMALCNWTYADVGKYCNTERGWGINSLSDLKPDQLAKVIAHIKVNAR